MRSRANAAETLANSMILASQRQERATNASQIGTTLLQTLSAASATLRTHVSATAAVSPCRPIADSVNIVQTRAMSMGMTLAGLTSTRETGACSSGLADSLI